jgi:hypothetical protein
LKKRLPFVLVSTALLGVAAFVFQSRYEKYREPEVPQIGLECEAISVALKGFEVRFGKLPTGNTPAVLQAPSGSNVTSERFLNPWRTNAQGDALDPWHTSYEISFPNGTNIQISSAGKNRKFGDADDFYYDGRRNRFVKPAD